MNRVDWFYSRKSCKACAKAKELLSKLGIKPSVSVDASRRRLDKVESFRLAKQVQEVYATHRGFVLYLNLRKARPDTVCLSRMILGPGGHLRTPAMKTGRALVVGFDENSYRSVLDAGMREPKLAAV
jgi:arsenate reductase-like glutaredoxin family protein